MQNRNIRAVVRKAGAAVALASLNVAAFAQANGGGVDTTSAVTEITASKTAVLAIGLAVFGVAVGIKLYKWIKSAL